MKFIQVIAFVVLIFSVHNSLFTKPKKVRKDFGSRPIPCLTNVDKLGSRRNLVILQDDVNEIDGILGACTLTLLRALQAESSPILVSSGLWFNMCLYLHAHGNEHQLKPRRKDWELYRVTSDIYCAIPTKYRKKINYITDDFSAHETVRDCFSGNLLTRDDLTLGIKCNQLKKIESPFSISWTRLIGYRLRIMGNAFSFHAAFTPDVLRKVLLTSDDIANINQYPACDIFMVGHGRASCIFSSVIAGCSISEFRSLLSFFNDSVHTHLFIYQTCFGGGKHLIKPFVTDGNPDLFNYAIISCCTGAMPSSVYLDPQTKHVMDFGIIFKDVADISLCEDNFQERLVSFYPCHDEAPKKRVLHNIPSIRWPGKPDFEVLTSASSNSTIQVFKPAEAIGGNVVIDGKQAFLFYDHGITHAPIVLKGSCPALISMDPTSDVTVINTLDAHEHTFHDVLLHCFAPISMLEAPASIVLINDLQCKLDDTDTTSSILHNVTVKSYRSTPALETLYERQLDAKYYYNFALRKRVTYELNGKVYKFTVKPKHGPDYLGKILMVAEALFANAYGVNPHVAQFSVFAQDLDPKRLWIFSKERKLRNNLASRYEKEFTAQFDQIAIPVAARYQLALSNVPCETSNTVAHLAKS